MEEVTVSRQFIDAEYEDLDTYDLEANVQRGADLLDEKVPGWAATVRDNILDGLFSVRDWDRCVIGTLELLRAEAGCHVIVFNGTMINKWGNATCALGFDVAENVYDKRGSAAFVELRRLWEIEVVRRVGIQRDPVTHD